MASFHLLGFSASSANGPCCFVSSVIAPLKILHDVPLLRRRTTCHSNGYRTRIGVLPFDKCAHNIGLSHAFLLFIVCLPFILQSLLIISFRISSWSLCLLISSKSPLMNIKGIKETSRKENCDTTHQNPIRIYTCVCRTLLLNDVNTAHYNA